MVNGSVEEARKKFKAAIKKGKEKAETRRQARKVKLAVRRATPRIAKPTKFGFQGRRSRTPRVRTVVVERRSRAPTNARVPKPALRGDNFTGIGRRESFQIDRDAARFTDRVSLTRGGTLATPANLVLRRQQAEDARLRRIASQRIKRGQPFG